MSNNWLYTVSPKGWLDLPRDEKRKLSAKIVDFGYEYKRHKLKDHAQAEADRIYKGTGIHMDVIEVMPAMMPF